VIRPLSRPAIALIPIIEGSQIFNNSEQQLSQRGASVESHQEVVVVQKFHAAFSTFSLVLLFGAGNHGAQVAQAQDSEAQTTQIRVSSTHRAYECQNPSDTFQLTGSDDVVNLTGSCGSLQVTGHGNTITIDSIQTVQFTGDGNSVLYRTSRPQTVQDNGQNNSVARARGEATSSRGNTVSSSGAAPGSDDQTSVTVSGGSVGDAIAAAQQAAQSASEAVGGAADAVQGVQVNGNTLNIILSKRQIDQDCANGRMVNISGYQNDITLTGTCSKVILNGWGNTIHIDSVGAVEVGGHDNNITWALGRKPIVQIDSGFNNSVHHVTPANQ
jgi:hypothetical protein